MGAKVPLRVCVGGIFAFRQNELDDITHLYGGVLSEESHKKIGWAIHTYITNIVSFNKEPRAKKVADKLISIRDSLKETNKEILDIISAGRSQSIVKDTFGVSGDEDFDKNVQRGLFCAVIQGCEDIPVDKSTEDSRVNLAARRLIHEKMDGRSSNNYNLHGFQRDILFVLKHVNESIRSVSGNDGRIPDPYFSPLLLEVIGDFASATGGGIHSRKSIDLIKKIIYIIRERLREENLSKILCAATSINSDASIKSRIRDEYSLPNSQG